MSLLCNIVWGGVAGNDVGRSLGYRAATPGGEMVFPC